MTLAPLALVLALAGAADTASFVHPPRGLFVREFSFSPDGRELLFSGSFGPRSALFRCTLEGQAPRAVSDTSGWHQWGSWSPDGAAVVYAAQSDSLSHLRLLDLASGRERRLTRDAAAEGTPAWSPDGRHVAYGRRVGERMQLWVARADGRGARALGGAVGIEYNPAWSPDGEWIAYYRSAGRTDSLVLVRADGGQRRVIGEGMWPSWSPDGRWLVYTRGSAASGPQIWRMTPDASEQRFVAEQAFFARYTPDGEHIAFLRLIDADAEPGSHLYWVRLDGSGLERLLPR